MSRTFVVHYSEVALKGKNRPEFARALTRNIKRALWGMNATVSQSESRIFVEVDDREQEVAEKLSRVFGVSWFAPASSVPPDYESVRDATLRCAVSLPGRTFRISARRSDKSFPMTSGELDRTLGSEVVGLTARPVDLSSPDATIHVDVLRRRALVYSARTRGPGGLPVGTAGRTMHLFSGGIDSPVAAWLLMKRGCRPVYLHFHASPPGEAPMDGKVARLVKVLAGYCGKSTLVLVPFAEYQIATMDAPGELEPSLFRRFMRISAEALAPAFNASGISTGDSLSQAASQTLWNIRTFDEGSSLPVLRPLLTYDKEEIVSLAREIGTYELSLEEYKDCCSIVSRHPKTRAKAATVSEFATRLAFSDFAWKSFDQGTLISYDPERPEPKVLPLGDALRRAASRDAAPRPLASRQDDAGLRSGKP